MDHKGDPAHNPLSRLGVQREAWDCPARGPLPVSVWGNHISLRDQACYGHLGPETFRCQGKE